MGRGGTIAKEKRLRTDSDEAEHNSLARKVYTVDEALGIAARKGIEATIAEQKKLASDRKSKEEAVEGKLLSSEVRPIANKAKWDRLRPVS